MRLYNRLSVLGCLLGAILLPSISGCSSGNSNLSLPAPVGTAQNEPPITECKKFIYLLLDTSGSMAGSKMSEAKAAIGKALEHTPDGTAMGFAVFDSFGSGAHELVPMSYHGKDKIRLLLPEIGTGGGTPLGASLRFSVDKVAEVQEKKLGYGEFNIIVVTDGESSDDLTGPVKYLREKRVYNAPVMLYTIGYHLASHHTLKQASVWYGEANDAASLEAKLIEATNSEAANLDDLIK